MSTTDTPQDGVNLLTKCEQFLRRYYSDEVGELAQHYPREQTSLYIDWSDLHQFDPDIADDYRSQPDQIREYLSEALSNYDLPVDIDLSGATIRVRDLDNPYIYGVGELRSEHSGQYVGVYGLVEQVTPIADQMTAAAFECQRCGVLNKVPQTADDWQEPHECKGCERQGPFQVNFNQSETVDHCKVKLKQPPGKAASGSGEHIEVHTIADLVDYGSDQGLQGRTGERAVVYGRVELSQIGGERSKKPLFERYLSGQAIDFEGKTSSNITLSDEDVAEIKQYAGRDDAAQVFAESIAPQIEQTDDWETIFYMGAAYLFGSPRIDPDDGPTYRGDIHLGIFGDPGMAKSVFLAEIATISPGSEYRSATGLASDVGLTAAAVRDDFGEGSQWTLKAGILPRPECHAIIDEIDKGPDELTAMNDGLEGDQTITIDKAGINATLETRVGLLVSGNPEKGRFDPYEPIADQVGVDSSFLSRLDGFVTLVDEVDVDQDGDVAQHILDSYDEGAQLERGEDPDRVATNREVPKHILSKWVKYAREAVDYPVLSEDVKDRLREFYVDTRDLNDGDTIPITARKLEAGLRFTVAFARLRLSDRVEMQDADLAIRVSKSIVGENFDPESGEFDADRSTEATDKAQRDRIKGVKDAIQDLEEEYAYDEGVPVDEVLDAVEEMGIERSKAEHEVEKLKQKGEAYEPSTGTVRTT